MSLIWMQPKIRDQIRLCKYLWMKPFALKPSLSKLVGWLTPALVGLVTLAVFSPVLQNWFIDWDDDVNIVENVNFRGLGWRQLRWMFTNLDMGHYQPLSWVTLGLDYVLWGLDPFGYHLTNLLLHAANAVVFYFVALRLLSAVFRESIAAEELSLRVAAALAALLFAIHPLRVESGAWVTERRGLLAGLFFLLSILFYLRANLVFKDSGAARLRWMAAAVMAYGFSLLSKASGLALPVVLLTLDVYPLARLGGGIRSWLDAKYRGVFWEKVPFAALALAAMAGAFVAEHQRGALRGLNEFGIVLRIAHAFFGLAFYLWKTLVPAGLAAVYSAVTDAVPAYWWIQPSEGMILGLSVAIVLTLSIVFFLLRRRWPAGLVNWVCYVALLAPVLGFVRFGGMIAGDRYSYLAGLGLPLLAAGGALSIRRSWMGGGSGRGRLVSMAALSAVILVGLGYLSWRQTQLWHDSNTLFGHVLKVAPRSKMAHANLGYVLASQGELDEAVKHYRLALQTDPDYSVAYYDLADALSQQGKLDEAVEAYRQVIRISPRFVITYQRMGNLLAQRGRLEEAIDAFRRAIEIRPDFDIAQNNLGLVLATQGKLDEAITHYRKALEVNPQFVFALTNLGDALVSKGEVDEGIKQFRRALEIQPGFAPAHYSLGRALTQKGRLAEAAGEYGQAAGASNVAVAHYELGNQYLQRGGYLRAIEQYRQAVQLDNRYAEAYSNMGSAFAALDKPEEAARYFRRAIEIAPRYAPAHYNLGNALLKKSEVAQAIRAYRRAIEIHPRYVEARTNLASALQMADKKDEAVAEYREALKIDPRYAPAHFNLGLLLGERGDVEGAMDQIRRVIEIDPRDPEARYELGRLLAGVGRVKEAAAEFKEALRIDPQMTRAQQSLRQLP